MLSCHPAMVMATTLTLILLMFSPNPTLGFDGRLAIGTALDTSEFTMRTEFPASVGEQLHLAQFPFTIFGREVDQIKIYSNGFVVLGNHSLEVPLNYPGQTAYSKHRLNEMEGDFIGVFTTVNQCSPKGRIIIRDLDVNEVESNTCGWDHMARIGSIIDTASQDEEDEGPFVADYILAITWENMGCVPSTKPLLNTFTLALVRMEDRSYAVFQYEDIQWTADHSTSSLPPEAGIFIHGVDTPQLPRNNMHIDPNVWNEESNIAVPGEWLFPLYEAPIDVDVAAQSKIRMNTEEFLEKSAYNCRNMSMLSTTTTTTAPTEYTTETETVVDTVTYLGNPEATYPNVMETTGYQQTTSDMSDNTYKSPETEARQSMDLEMQFRRCESSECTSSTANCFLFDGQRCCVCPPNYYGGGEEGCWSTSPDKPRRIYLDGEMVINIPDTSGQTSTANVFLDTEVRGDGSILSQSGVHNSPKDFPTLHAISPIFSILNTFLAISSNQIGGGMNTRLFNIFSITSGFKAPFNFSFSIDVAGHGRLNVRGSLRRQNSAQDTFRGSLKVEVNPEGSFTPLRIPLVGSDGLLQSDNRLDRSLEYQKTGTGRLKFTSQTYNLKPEHGEMIRVTVYGSGEASVHEGACLLAENSLMQTGQKFSVNMGSQGYCREDCRDDYGCSFYCVDMPNFAGMASGIDNPPTDKPVCQLELDTGPCRQSLLRYGYDYKAGQCREFYYGGCKGNANNFESMADCEAKCGGNSSNNQPNGNGDPCQQPVVVGPCRAAKRRYAYNSQTRACELFIYGGCGGNDNNFERLEDCQQRCESSYSPDPCSGVRCGENAYCHSGYCYCNSGYEGDGFTGCRASVSANACENMRCGYNARCVNGRCECDEGYSGDAYTECRQNEDQNEDICSLPTVAGPCSAAQLRYSFNRSSGRCEPFYYGGCGGNKNNFERFEDCRQRCESSQQQDPCSNVRCGYNAFCHSGYCYCNSGYQGDPNIECKPTSPGPSSDSCSLPIEKGPCNALNPRYAYNSSKGNCELFYYGGCEGNANNFERIEDCQRQCMSYQIDMCASVKCAENAYCVDGYCYCKEGYQGDANVECRPSYADACAEVRCGFNARCENGYCFCNPGYEGDANTGCRPTESDPCSSVRCGDNAYCTRGYCYCNQGYEGDANTGCRPVGSSELCSGVRCGENAECIGGQCKCQEGFYGDPQQSCRFIGGDKPSSNPRCRSQIDAGQCFGRIPNYGYNSRTGRCEEFMYTGCMGNENRFDTLEECQRVCGSFEAKDPCEGVRCGYNAKCVEGQCVCEPGFMGDPTYECKSSGTDLCYSVRCGHRARCQDGYCVCEPGYSGDPYRECQPDDACSDVRCGYNARCVRGRCECESGYSGDPYSECRADRCSGVRCGYYARCVEGRCECESGYGGDPYSECKPDRCSGVRCGYYARCVDGRCECESGYTGDAYIECRLDLCRDVVCGQNAQCIDGSCKCLPGYEGDPQRECRTGENCRGQRCGPNAYCRDEVCLCETGYQGNPYSGCEPVNSRCDGVQCASNAYCDNGYCHCNPGYSGDGFLECYYQGSCANVQCGTNAKCEDGRCLCWPGYTGDPDRECMPSQDSQDCNGRRCGSNAVCDRGVCICKPGYEGDPYYACTEVPAKPEICGNTYCHHNARCFNNACFCEYGYVGDGVRVCEKVEEDLCKRVNCAENAECEAGLCQCKPGFQGDGFSECTPVEVDPNSCNGSYCGANAECRDGQCVCYPGYTGDAYDICTRERPLPDSCYGIECGSNAYCQGGTCVCYEGFEGDPNLACKPIHDSSCMGIRCGVNAYCMNGQCLCRQDHRGDPNQICYPDWGTSTPDQCATLNCHPNATCSGGQCHCSYGFEGDGFIDCWPKDPANLCDCFGVSTSMAGCSNGKCRCLPGFRMSPSDGRCEECRGHGGCAANAQCSYDRQAQAYRCACDPGYHGDGAIACIPGSVANRTEAGQCRVPCHRFATCEEYDGRCKCRSGFLGNGYTYCDFDCGQCLPEARCVPESSQCVCPNGFTGDGIRTCRPATNQGVFTLRIERPNGESTIRIREGAGPLELRCVLTGDVRTAQVRWLTPGDVGRSTEERPGELLLTLDAPRPEHSGSYICQAARVSDSVRVIVEPQLQSQTKQLFLTSDNGILNVQTQTEATTAAQIWHIAENNKHKRVALALDCKTERLIYTSDGGQALRFGNASTPRLDQPPKLIFQDAFAKFSWLAVDPTSGNVFAIDQKQSRIVVVNPDRPKMVHTFKKLAERKPSIDFLVGGIAVHPGLSLVYWAQMETAESDKRESVIKVASMADPDRVDEIARVSGAPISMSLAVTNDMSSSSSTAGRLCWFQRKQMMPYSRTEIHCAQLDASGRSAHSKRLLKAFDSNEEPSCGLIQDDHTILWTTLYRKIYRSLNPSSSVYVKGVCCSNGFQSMALHAVCRRSMTNTCSYENGRCRFFCLPGGNEMARVCRCPDDQPNCVAEYA